MLTVLNVGLVVVRRSKEVENSMVVSNIPIVTSYRGICPQMRNVQCGEFMVVKIIKEKTRRH